MVDLVTWFALIAGALCFLLYLVLAIVAAFAANAAAKQANATVANAAAGTPVDGGKALPTVSDLTTLIDSLSKLTDSLSKVAPSTVALIGALLFFSIAAISGGALRPSPAPNGAGAASNSAQAASNSAPAATPASNTVPAKH